MAVPKSIKTYLGIALLFLILGVGNISFSSSKIAYYQKLLQEAQTKKLTPSETRIEYQNQFFPYKSTEDSPVGADAHEKRLNSRLSYYEFAYLGGAVFIGLSGILMLFSLLLLSRESFYESDENTAS